MVISLSPVKRNKKECIWVEYLIYAILLRFFSRQNLYSHRFRVHKKMVFSKSDDTLQILLILFFTVFLFFLLKNVAIFILITFHRVICHQQFILGQLKLPRDSKTKITLKYAAKKDFSIKKEFWLFLLFFVNFSIYGQGHQHCLQSDRLVKSFRLYRRYHGP